MAAFDARLWAVRVTGARCGSDVRKNPQQLVSWKRGVPRCGKIPRSTIVSRHSTWVEGHERDAAPYAAWVEGHERDAAPYAAWVEGRERGAAP
ncbi:MAG: hypothetical protein JWN41_1130 [Thermoleophilia bacterium]|nr:hypothetical protein [Thermoleophilia bacterium]